MEIHILKADISDVEADAIVNASDTSLRMGGGVAGAIKRRGGIEIEEDALSKGPIPLGEAVASGPGRLRARYVIHAAAMPNAGDRKATPESVRNATANALRLADGLGCESIAIPALGCGIAGFPADDGAKIIVNVVDRFKPANLKEVLLVLYSDDAYEIFKKALSGTCPSGHP